MTIPFKKPPTEFNQRLLFPTNIFDLLPSDHECFIYEDIFETIDTSKIEAGYSVIGQNAYHPKSKVAILIYAYSQGVFSSRQIEKKCSEDLSFMYISKMNCPNFRVLSDFRKNHYEFFKKCFKHTVMMAINMGMASLGHVSLDGSKFKADTSKHKAMSYGRLKEKENEIAGEIEALIGKAAKCDEEEDKEHGEKTGYEIEEELVIKKERLKKIKAAKEALEEREKELNPGKKIKDKKQISFADKEARIMGKNGQFDYSYNGQISVDEENQIIVGQHLSQNANDKKEVEAALEKIKDAAGGLPAKMSMDNGYESGNNLETIAGAGIDAYVATGKENKKSKSALEETNRKITKSDFRYDAERDRFICPQGEELAAKSEIKSGKIYAANKETCCSCEYRKRCCNSTNSGGRTIKTDDKEPLRQAMIEKMEKEESKEIYGKRKTIVEPVFGQIKNSGFRGFNLRGRKKAEGEFSLVCAVHNIKKIVKAITRGEVRLGGKEIAINTY